MTVLHFVIPGELNARTGGYRYDSRVVQELRQRGWRVNLYSLADRFPFPDPAALRHAEQTLAAIPDGALVVIDGLALGGIPDLTVQEANRLRLVALIHHPLAAETGLTPVDRKRLFANERTALAAVQRIIVTSPHTAQALRAYGVAAECIGIVPPGVESAPLAVGSKGDALTLFCVATLTPRKGHRVLLEALARLRDRRWRLRCVGSLTRSPGTAAAVQAQIHTLQLADRVKLLGEVDEQTLETEYQHADLFVLPSFYEGYGMVLTEALARGLAVISTQAGAIPDTVPPEAGLLVPPGDSEALAAALSQCMDDAGYRERLSVGARAARKGLSTWTSAGDQFLAELQRVP